MKVIAIIPARYESSRFPGKPLTDIAGKSMIQRIYEQVRACTDIDDVLIATDDKRISDAAASFGAPVVMTSPECRSGTDRVAQAAMGLSADAVINVQGDQVVLDSRAPADRDPRRAVGHAPVGLGEVAPAHPQHPRTRRRWKKAT